MKKLQKKVEIKLPSEAQRKNAEKMGWEYLGEGYFAKDQMIGYFTVNHGFVIEE